MKGCFTFQCGVGLGVGGCCLDGGALFLSGGCTPWGASVLMGWVFEKNCRMGGCPGAPPPQMLPPLWETLHKIKVNGKIHFLL